MRLILVTLLAVLAAPANADEGPAIERVEVRGQSTTSLPRGAMVMLRGRGLHACPLPERPGQRCRHDEMSVRIDLHDLGILDCSAEHVLVDVPHHVPAGRGRLVIQLRDRGRTAVEVEVVEPPVPPAAPPPARVLQAFRITRFAWIGGQDGAWLEIDGRASDVPAGSCVIVTVSFEGRHLEAESSVTRAGAFQARLGPFARPFPAGEYRVVAMFERAKQSRMKARELRRTAPAEDLFWYERIDCSERLSLGTDEDRARERDATHAHHHAYARALAKIVDESDRWRAALAISKLRLPFGARPPQLDETRCRTWIGAMLDADLPQLVADAQDFDARWAFPLTPPDRLAWLARASVCDLAVRAGAARDDLEIVGDWRPRFTTEREQLLARVERR